jgi:hypothetical protein
MTMRWREVPADPEARLDAIRWHEVPVEAQRWRR